MEATLTHVHVKQPAVSFFLFNVHYSMAWINSLLKTDSLCSIYCHPNPKLKKQLRCEEPSCSKVDWQHQTTYLVFILGLESPIRVSATWFSWTAFTLIEHMQFARSKLWLHIGCLHHCFVGWIFKTSTIFISIIGIDSSLPTKNK